MDTKDAQPDFYDVDDERHGLDRRELLERGAGLGLALAAPAFLGLEELAGAAGHSSSASGTARFLIAENFWANWEPYQNTAQSQFRINEQIYDHLVEFPTGDISEPKPALATSWKQVDALPGSFKLRRGAALRRRPPSASRTTR